jgi:hypothetical protein
LLNQNANLSTAVQIGHLPGDALLSAEFSSDYSSGYTTENQMQLDRSFKQCLHLKFMCKNGNSLTAINNLFQIANYLQKSQEISDNSSYIFNSCEILSEPTYRETSSDGMYIYVCIVKAEILI